MSVVTKVWVRDLYGEFDHTVTINPDWQFAIIYGPNGVGKTRLFEIINALSQVSHRKLARFDFTAAGIEYSDGAQLSVSRSLDTRGSSTLDYSLVLHDFERQWSWSTSDDETSRRRLVGSRWIDLGDGFWLDQSDNEIVPEDELFSRYGYSRHSTEIEGTPDFLVEFTSERQTHLIETQRLTGQYLRNGPRPRGYRPNEDTVSIYAEDLKSRLNSALGDNSRSSQSLDRTFPNRLLALELPARGVTEAGVRARYESQNDKRARLAELGLTRDGDSVDLPEGKLDPFRLSVLDLYLRDTEQKLQSFDDILARVDLLKSIVNKRFLRKRLTVNSEVGLAITQQSRDEDLHPRALSSGEKHELIMFYDLLFRARPGTLVLIDEPEISLHVSWQREFLQDIIQVANLTGIRALIATHSPQIIGPHRDRTMELGTAQDMREME